MINLAQVSVFSTSKQRFCVASIQTYELIQGPCGLTLNQVPSNEAVKSPVERYVIRCAYDAILELGSKQYSASSGCDLLRTKKRKGIRNSMHSERFLPTALKCNSLFAKKTQVIHEFAVSVAYFRVMKN